MPALSGMAFPARAARLPDRVLLANANLPYPKNKTVI